MPFTQHLFICLLTVRCLSSGCLFLVVVLWLDLSLRKKLGKRLSLHSIPGIPLLSNLINDLFPYYFTISSFVSNCMSSFFWVSFSSLDLIFLYILFWASSSLRFRTFPQYLSISSFISQVLLLAVFLLTWLDLPLHSILGIFFL
jgi:hypothetical protein